MEINWSLLADAPNPGNAFLQGMEQGRERKRATEERNVLAEIATKWPSPNGSTGGIMADPREDERQFNELITPLAKLNPQMAIKMRQQFYSDRQGQQEVAQKQNEAQQNRILTMGKLINQAVDEPSYQQSLAAARQMGMDVSSAPPQFDPNWIAQQRMIVGAFSKDGGQQISGIARELQDAGYKPGTPEFAEAMRGVIQNKYASDYVDEQGNTRRRSALNLQGGASVMPPQTPPPPSGLVASGNIDIHNRPIVKNKDGSISTVRSMSFGTDQGEVLVPTVSEDGRIMTDQEAIDQYRQTGRHLGVFRTPEDATRYAESLHNQQANEYLPRGGDVGFMTFDQFNAMRSVPTFRPGHPAWNTPVRVDQSQYAKLPSGKTFIAPDGSVRIKP